MVHLFSSQSNNVEHVVTVNVHTKLKLILNGITRGNIHTTKITFVKKKKFTLFYSILILCSLHLKMMYGFVV